MMYRRGPGLLGAAARTAVVVGTAGAVSHRQQARYAARQAQQKPEQQEQPAQQSETAEGPPATGSDVVAQIEKLADLKSQGLLTDEEYAAAKVKLLGS